jgi:hypothetical protein
MLVLTRRVHEAVVLADQTIVTLVVDGILPGLMASPCGERTCL